MISTHFQKHALEVNIRVNIQYRMEILKCIGIFHRKYSIRKVGVKYAIRKVGVTIGHHDGVALLG
eukprot:SAG11_NODE_14711_length_602_cov_1.296223_1_plen_65_part_01